MSEEKYKELLGRLLEKNGRKIEYCRDGKMLTSDWHDGCDGFYFYDYKEGVDWEIGYSSCDRDPQSLFLRYCSDKTANLGSITVSEKADGEVYKTVYDVLYIQELRVKDSGSDDASWEKCYVLRDDDCDGITFVPVKRSGSREYQETDVIHNTMVSAADICSKMNFKEIDQAFVDEMVFEYISDLDYEDFNEAAYAAF